jgi:c-di-GMP-binding flagellar brake protein YcgR
MSMSAHKLPRLNMLVTIEVGHDKKPYAYASRVESVDGGTLSVAMPSERGSLVILQPGTEVRVFFNDGSAMFSFAADVAGHCLDPIPMLVLANFGAVTKAQRRRLLRVSAMVFPVESWVLDKDPEKCRPITMATVDISGGGIRFVGGDRLEKDTRVRVKLDLPCNCGTIEAVIRVLRVHERGDAIRSRYETATAFLDISEGDRDRICRFALRQQLELVKRGIEQR